MGGWDGVQEQLQVSTSLLGCSSGGYPDPSPQWTGVGPAGPGFPSLLLPGPTLPRLCLFGVGGGEVGRLKQDPSLAYLLRNWAITEPNNWQGHEEGGSEDCAEILPSGQWNDNFCQQVNRWACEKRRNVTH